MANVNERARAVTVRFQNSREDIRDATYTAVEVVSIWRIRLVGLGVVRTDL